MKKMFSIFLCIVLALGAFSGCTKQEPAAAAPTEEVATAVTASPEPVPAEPTPEPIVWRFVSAFNENAAEHYGFWKFFDRVNNELGDRLKIEYIGGTEIVAYFDQFEQLGQGVFEIGHIPVNMTENITPIGDALYLTELNPMEMRESGAYDFCKEIYAAQGNVVYLGVTSGEDYGYTIYTNFEVNSLDAFKGKTIRTAPVFVPLLEALGAGAVAIGAGEVYQALERGVVDGAGWSTIGAADYAWYEVLKYRIDPIFYKTNIGMFVNREAFNALDAELQADVLRIAQEVEAECYTEMGAMVAKEFATLEANGMQTITLEGEVRELWLKTAQEAGWAHFQALDPVNAELIRPLVTKD